MTRYERNNDLRMKAEAALKAATDKTLTVFLEKAVLGFEIKAKKMLVEDAEKED